MVSYFHILNILLSEKRLKLRNRKRNLNFGAMRWLYWHLVDTKDWGAEARIQSDEGHKVVVYWWIDE